MCVCVCIILRYIYLGVCTIVNGWPAPRERAREREAYNQQGRHGGMDV